MLASLLRSGQCDGLETLHVGEHMMGSLGVRRLAVAASLVTSLTSIDLSCGDVTRAGPGVNVPGLVLELDGSIAGLHMPPHATDTSAPPEFGSWFTMDGALVAEPAPDVAWEGVHGDADADATTAEEGGGWEESKGVDTTALSSGRHQARRRASIVSMAQQSQEVGGAGTTQQAYAARRSSTIAALEKRRRHRRASVAAASEGTSKHEEGTGAGAGAGAGVAAAAGRQAQKGGSAADADADDAGAAHAGTVMQRATSWRRGVVVTSGGVNSDSSDEERRQTRTAHVVEKFAEVAALLDSLQHGGRLPPRKAYITDYVDRKDEETVDCRHGIGALGLEGVVELLAYGHVTHLRCVFPLCFAVWWCGVDVLIGIPVQAPLTLLDHRRDQTLQRRSVQQGRHSTGQCATGSFHGARVGPVHTCVCTTASTTRCRTPSLFTPGETADNHRVGRGTCAVILDPCNGEFGAHEVRDVWPHAYPPRCSYIVVSCYSFPFIPA